MSRPFIRLFAFSGESYKPGSCVSSTVESGALIQGLVFSHAEFAGSEIGVHPGQGIRAGDLIVSRQIGTVIVGWLFLRFWRPADHGAQCWEVPQAEEVSSTSVELYGPQSQDRDSRTAQFRGLQVCRVSGAMEVRLLSPLWASSQMACHHAQARGPAFVPCR